MQSSIDSHEFPISVVQDGQRFVATSTEFPELKGEGHRMGDAIDALGLLVRAVLEDRHRAEALHQHPLWPTISEWCSTTAGPAMPWLPPHDFQAALKSLGFDPFQNRCIQQTYDHAEILRRALVGGEYDGSAHEVLYQAAEHDLGWALCFAAGVAFRIDHQQQQMVAAENKARQTAGKLLLPAPKVFSDFADSTRHVEIVEALEAWRRRPDILTDTLLDDKVVPWLNKLSDSGADEVAAAFYTSALTDSLGTKHMRNAQRRADWNAERDAKNLKRRRADGANARKPAAFRKRIELYWVSAALWCKSTAEILAALDPARKENVSAAYEKIERDISALHFAGSRLKSR